MAAHMEALRRYFEFRSGQQEALIARNENRLMEIRADALLDAATLPPGETPRAEDARDGGAPASADRRTGATPPPTRSATKSWCNGRGASRRPRWPKHNTTHMNGEKETDDMKKNSDRALEALARKGRGGDTEIGHLTEGELVVPVSILARFPEARDALFDAFREAGIDPDRYIVGEAENSVNPETGVPEFYGFDASQDQKDNTADADRRGFSGGAGKDNENKTRSYIPKPLKLDAEFADFITEDGRRLEDVLGKGYFKPFKKDPVREARLAQRRGQAKRLNQTKATLTGPRGVAGPVNTVRKDLSGG